MSQKVAVLEQEIERLTDGAELENVSPPDVLFKLVTANLSF